MMHDHAPPPTTAAAAASQTALAGDAAAGRQVFRKCQACHSLEAGKNCLGPSLAGIVGEKAAAVPGYNFSAAMKASNLVWDAATLDAYLTRSAEAGAGNKMPFPGLKTERERERRDRLARGQFEVRRRAAAPGAATTAAQKLRLRRAARCRHSAPASSASTMPGPSYVPGLRYTLRSGIAEGRMVFIGVGGTIDGQVNPLLSAAEGQIVQIMLINGEGAEHDIVFADQGPAGNSAHIVGKGASTSIAFAASQGRRLLYYCSVPGHRLAGMEGKFLVTPQPPPQTVVEADISQKANRRSASGRQPGPADGAGRSRHRRARSAARGRHDVRLLDLQRQGPRSDAACPRRRHGRRAPEKRRQQFDAAFGRFSRRHRAGRRRRLHADRSGRGEESSSSRRWLPACTSITAPRRWWPITSPTACMDSFWSSPRAVCRRSIASST